MSLRVLDDDRPGFALLSFSGRLEQPSLSLSIRSLRENAFLGPEGKWQRTAHFFTAERAGETSRGTEYRVGPEIVNHLLEHDQIIVANADGTLREETLWENAVPQMPGSGAGHSIYRPPVKLVGTEPAPAKMEMRAAPEPAPPPEPPAPVAPPTPAPAPPQPQVVARPVPAPRPRVETTPPSPSPAPPTNWLKYLPLAAIPVVLIALFAVPQLRCSLFGMSCPAPAKDLLAPAMACATERERPRPCEVKACFDTYLADTAPRDVAPQATAVIDSANQACRTLQAAAAKEAKDRADRAAESDTLQRARQCASGANACSAKSCYDGYMARYGSTGTYSGDARREIAAAGARCPQVARAMPDGTYNAASLPGCDTPAQQGIRVTVASGKLSWQHEFKGTRYNWSGTVDDNGFIRAAAGVSLIASGRYSDSQRDVQMQYPQCGPEGITLDIIGRR
jgi:hypothetical protein